MKEKYMYMEKFKTIRKILFLKVESYANPSITRTLISSSQLEMQTVPNVGSMTFR